MTPETLEAIRATIEEAKGKAFSIQSYKPVSGGDINNSFLLANGDDCYFVKTNNPKHLTMLEREQTSLRTLAAAEAMAVPQPVAVGTTDDTAYLVLEYHRMRHRGDGRELARGLVKVHQQTSANGCYGWEEDNFIGTSPQSNEWREDWTGFWRDQRLNPQLHMAYESGYAEALEPLATPLGERLPEILGDHKPHPSLLHGDLWGGNAAYLPSGEPIIYDPASYYGDREADLALTELFGGFSAEFYDEYQNLWPLEPGYSRRKKLYNLYHLLNHLNLFGAGYLGQCRNVMTTLVGKE